MSGRMGRVALVLLATLALVLGPVGAALAAAPGNDSSATPTVIAAIPFVDAIDTTEATSEAGDPADCVFNSHTVWYQFTASEATDLLADTAGSDYDTVLHVGIPDGLGGMAVIACNDDTTSLQAAVRFTTEPGQTYLIAVGSFADSPGGSLHLSLDVAPPPLMVELTVHPTGSFTRYGSATLHGTIACSPEAGWAFVSVDLSQRVGRFTIRGWGETFIEPCGPEPAPWSLTVTGEDGRFAGGRAIATTFAFACGPIECAEAFVRQDVRLRR